MTRYSKGKTETCRDFKQLEAGDHFMRKFFFYVGLLCTLSLMVVATVSYMWLLPVLMMSGYSVGFASAWLWEKWVLECE